MVGKLVLHLVAMKAALMAERKDEWLVDSLVVMKAAMMAEKMVAKMAVC